MTRYLPILTILLVGCAGNQPTQHPDHHQFQSLLAAEGGWHDIQWDEDGLGVKIKHQVPEFLQMLEALSAAIGREQAIEHPHSSEEELKEKLVSMLNQYIGPEWKKGHDLTFVVRRSSVTVYAVKENTLWSKSNGKIEKKTLLPMVEDKVERLADQLLDAFNGS